MVFLDRRRTSLPLPSALNKRCNKYGKISSFGFSFRQRIGIKKQACIVSRIQARRLRSHACDAMHQSGKVLEMAAGL